MRRDSTGRYEITSTAGEVVRAFVPAPLQADPPLVPESPLLMLNDRVHLDCVSLDETLLIPDRRHPVLAL